MTSTAKRVVVWGTGFVGRMVIPEILRHPAFELVGKFPLRRMTEDGEVADVAAFFASDLAKAVTGQHLMVNAGEMMH